MFPVLSLNRGACNAMEPMSALIVFLSFVSVLHARPDAEQERLWQIARLNNPTLRALDADILAARARLKRSQILLPANPELELSKRNGRLRTSPVLDPAIEGPLQSENQKTEGYALELSQEFEIAGQRGLRIDASSQELSALVASREARLREIFFGIQKELLTLSIRTRLLQVLDDQIASISRIETQYRLRGVRDARLGAYALDIIQSDLAILGIEKSSVFEDRQTSLRTIAILLGDAKANPAPAPDRVDLFVPLPDENLIFQGLSTDNPFVKETLARLKSGEAKLELARRSIYPNITAFLGMGTDRRGKGTSIAFPPLTSGPQAERERFVTFGVRIPIPVVDRGQGLEEEARADLNKMAITSESTRLQMEMRVAAWISRYAQLRESVMTLSAQVAKRNLIYARLDNAFLNGRMGYSEYWTERAKWMSMEREVNHAMLEAAEARAGIQILSGIDFNTGALIEWGNSK
jgi:outer membrane protein TolC